MHNHRHKLTRSIGAIAIMCAVALTASAPRNAHAGANAWTSNGPPGPQDNWVVAIVPDPGTPGTLYAGTLKSGLFKSTDSGGSWSAANSGLICESISALAIAPTTPSTMYAASCLLSKSTNGGASWTPFVGSGIAGSVSALAVDPQTPSAVYAGTFSGFVFKSDNAGSSWMSVSTGLPLKTIEALAVDPHSSSTLYAALQSGGVFKSSDGGGSWSPANNGINTANSSFAALAIDPTSSNTLYVGATRGVFKSTDGGGNWSPASTGLTYDIIPGVSIAAAITALAPIDRRNPRTLYAGTLQHGVYKSIDGGDHWAQMTTAGLTISWIDALAIDPGTTSTIYAGGVDGPGVFDIEQISGGPTGTPAAAATPTTPLVVPSSTRTSTTTATPTRKPVTANPTRTLPASSGPVFEQAYLKASNTNAHDQFGLSLDVSGDTVVIGAPYESSNATGVNGDQTNNAAPYSGAVYVFVRNGTTWTQQAYLKPSNTSVGCVFGTSVVVSGDTLVVGAVGENSDAVGVNGDQTDTSAPSAGAAYVFVRNGTVWTQQAYLKASNTRAGNFFGNSVAVSGDTAVIGSLHEASNATGIDGNQNDHSATDAGAAYVFLRNGTSWSQQAYLKASNAEAGDYFGRPVRISGNTVVVGAWYEGSSATGVNGNQNDNSAFQAGAAYVFVRNGATWSQEAYLKASNTEANDRFGTAVVDGDTVVVSAYGEASRATGVNGNQNDNGAPDAGAVYVFVRNGTMWSQQAYIKASNTEANDAFGNVALSGDTLTVGATHEASNATGVNGDQSDNSAPDSGAVYVFMRSGTTWTQQAYLKSFNTEAGDSFSKAAVSGNTIVVGAYQEDSNATEVNGDESDNSATEAGAVYVFSGEGSSGPTPTPPPATGLCIGDCDGSGEVTVNEIIILVNLALGTPDALPCPNGILSGEVVDITLIIRAVGFAQNNCPAS